MPPSLHVGIDVGGMNHRVAVGLSDGKLIDEFDVPHTHAGFNAFFERIGALQKTHTLPVIIAMEGCNRCVRPLDRAIQARGYSLYSVNNLKLARCKEIFPAPAKTDAINARRILELIVCRPICRWRKTPCRKLRWRRAKTTSLSA